MADFASGFAAGSKAINDIVDGQLRSQYYRELLAEKRQQREGQQKLSIRREDFRNWQGKQSQGSPTDYQTYQQFQGRNLQGTPDRAPAIDTPTPAADAPASAATPEVAPAISATPEVAPAISATPAATAAPAAGEAGAATAAAPAVAGEAGAAAAPIAAAAPAVAEAAPAAGAALGAAGAGVGEAGAALGAGAGSAIGAGAGAAAGAAGAGAGAAVGAAGAAVGEGVAAGAGAVGSAVGAAAPALAALVALREGGRVPTEQEMPDLTGAAPATPEVGGGRDPAIQDTPAPDTGGPAARAPQRDEGLTGAIHGFYDWVSGALGPREAVATSGSAAAQQSLARTMQQADPGAISQAARRAGDVPQGQPLTRMAWNDLNDMLTDHFLTQGDVKGLREAQGYLETARSNGASRALSMTVAAVQSGDMTGAARALTRANEFLPDGQLYSFQPTQGGLQVSVRSERGGADVQGQNYTLSSEQVLAYAHNLIDPEKQRTYLMNVRQQEEVERNGTRSRDSSVLRDRLAVNADGRAGAADSRAAAEFRETREGRALEREASAADVELERLRRPGVEATPEQIQAAQTKVDGIRSRMVTAQRAGVGNIDRAAAADSRAADTHTNAQTDRTTGQDFVGAIAAAQEAARKAEATPAGSPERAAADASAESTQAAVLQSFSRLNLGQATSAQNLTAKIEAMELGRQDRAAVGAFVETSAQVTEAQGALQQARTSRDPQALATAQAKLTEANVANRRALAGMSPTATTRLTNAMTAQEALATRGQGRTGGREVSSADLAKIEEGVDAAIDAMPADRRARVAPAQRAAIRDIAVSLGSTNRLAPKQSGEIAMGLHDGTIQVDPNSPVARTPSGTRIVLDPDTHATLVTQQQERAKAAPPERGSGAAIVGALSGRSSDPQRAAIQQRNADQSDLERRRANVRARNQQEGNTRQRRAAIHEGPGQ